MNAAWSADGPLSVQEAAEGVGGGNYKTVMTVLNRLVEKDMLAREMSGRAYRYRPAILRASFLRAAADGLVRDYLASFGPDAAGHLAEAAGASGPQPPAVAQASPAPPVYHIHQPPPPRRSLALPILAAALAAGLVVLARRRAG